MGKIRRVLMTTDTVGGVWTYTIELIRELQNYGIQVYCASMGALLTSGQREQIDGLQNATLIESNYKLEWMEEPWDDVCNAGKWLLGIENDYRPDIVHLNGFTHGNLPWKSPVLMVGHSCVVSWYQNVYKEDPPEIWYKYRKAVQEGLKAATMVVAPSEQMLSSLIDNYGPFQDCRVIYNGLNRGQYKREIKEPYIATVGRFWDEAKNITVLDKCSEKVSWPIYAAGGDNAATSKIKQLGKLTHAQVSGLLSKASIYALPARYEPFGLSILEAALSGCALVIGNIKSLHEIWGDAAFYVDPDNSEKIADTLNELIENSSLREEYGFRAYLRACRYTTRRMADLYNLQYKKLYAANRVQHLTCREN